MQENTNIKNIEEEVDIREIVKNMLNYKRFITFSSLMIVSVAFIYLLSIPNMYSSNAILMPQDNKVGGLGSLSAVASFAGVSVGETYMTPDLAYQSLLGNYAFMRNFVIENNITNTYCSENFSKNYVFAFGFRGLYDLVHFTSEKCGEDTEKDIYYIVKNLQKNFSVSSDEQSGLVSFAFTNPDRYMAQKMLTIFLEQSSKYLLENRLHTINRKLSYYQEELSKTDSFELRKNISELISKLVEEKISTKSSKYFQTEILTKPEIAYIKNKIGPSRGIILFLTLMVSLILSVFIVFMREILTSNR